jgi:hypothetical protein
MTHPGTQSGPGSDAGAGQVICDEDQQQGTHAPPTSDTDGMRRRADAAARLQPLASGARDPLFPGAADMEARWREWVSDSSPVLAYSPATPACTGECSALGIAELRWIGERGCSRCGQPPVLTTDERPACDAECGPGCGHPGSGWRT